MTDFNSAQYKRVIAACKERSEIPTMAWIPDKEECVHTQLHEAKVDFTDDSEYVRMFRQQTELIEKWVEEEEKRLPPMPPKSPYEANE
mgnify:CR=1 FL=1